MGTKIDRRSTQGKQALIVSGFARFSPNLALILRPEFDNIVEWPEERVLTATKFGQFEFIFLMVDMRPPALDFAFRIIGHLNEWRFLHSRRRIPEILVVAAAKLEDSVAADLEGRICHVLVQSPEQLLQKLGSLRVHRLRQCRKGFHLLLITKHASRQLFLVGPEGCSELTSNKRKIRLVLALNTESRAFEQHEIQQKLGWRVNQIRVYVDRVKEDFESSSEEAGIAASSDEFIEAVGKGSGWRMHAWIEKKSRD